MVGTVLLLPTEMICQISFETLKSNSQRIRGLGGIRTFGLTSASYPHGQSATTSKSKAGPLFPGMPFVARSSVITITCGHNSESRGLELARVGDRDSRQGNIKGLISAPPHSLGLRTASGNDNPGSS
ncbi:predicted protein [Histoplasma capsulatum H143]|uniref:Uncharacterized protein n=1 Tax=Ajellomyces capsulatus (strain H143) TaxID=544712 RepID=C6HHY5_AJECH|nr:predicted protein [Histoplasma capsulatum H143]